MVAHWSSSRTVPTLSRRASKGCPWKARPALCMLVLLFLFMAARWGLPPGMPQAAGGASELPQGSLYTSPQALARLWPNMSASGGHPSEKLEWRATWNAWEPCIARPQEYTAPPQVSHGYLLVVANGGLNQQRSAICNAVAVARLLNATLIVPHLPYNAVWKDPSTFEELFDVEHFMGHLAADVRIARSAPPHLARQVEDDRTKIKVPAWSSPQHYLSEVLPRLRQQGIVRLDPFANRLAYNGLPLPLQQLRCRANFEALRFAPPLQALADNLLHRLRARSSGGKYVAVHLRFERDMVAFSNCLYEGGAAEAAALAAYREYGWQGKFTRPGRKAKDPAAERRAGKCPLTPLEVGLMLRGVGFGPATVLFVAAGKVYGGEEMMAPLKQMFPQLLTKEALLEPEELAPLQKYSSRLAALDYTACLHSEVFVATQGGNFPQILEGHRRFLNKGHARTIRPDKRKLSLLLDDPHIMWDTFSKEMAALWVENEKKGAAPRKAGQNLYSYPAPECMCHNGAAAQKIGVGAISHLAASKEPLTEGDDEDGGTA